MRKEREPREGRHHAHAHKVGNGSRRGRRTKKRSIVLLLEADADFEAWFMTAKRQLGRA